MTSAPRLAWFLPELVLVAALLLVIGVDLLVTAGGRRAASLWPGNLALFGAGAALVLTLGLPALGVRGLLDDTPQAWLFDGMIVLDGFSVFFKVLLGL